MILQEKARRLREMVDDLACFGLDAECAAALRAGAEALERLEAMESTSSTMLPKSASASKESI